MPEFETGERTSIEDQKAIAKRMTARILGKPVPGEVPDNGTPFTDDQLTFLAMAFKDLMPRLGRKGKKLVEQDYDPVSTTFSLWHTGKRE
jgi:hypothetical protein